jgi:hypothetical protein
MGKQISVVFEGSEDIDEFEVIKKILELIRLAKLNIKHISSHIKTNKEIK